MMGHLTVIPGKSPTVKELTDYKNVVVVDAGGNGDYTAPSAALAAITDASVVNPYGISIMPGRYDVLASPIVLKPHVHLSAFLPGTVEIYSSTPSTELVRLYINTLEVFKIKVRSLNWRAATGNPYVLDVVNGPGLTDASNGVIEFEDCELTSTSTTSSEYLVHTSEEVNGYNAISRLRFTRSYLKHAGQGIHAVHAEDYLPMYFDNCRIGLLTTGAGSSPILNVNALKIYLTFCSLLGGANSISGSGSIVMTHCALQKAITGVSNQVATNNFVATNNAIDDF